MSNFQAFSQLHKNPEPLLLGNIWDVNSAKIFEAAGYKAIGFSSQAISNAFGYDDGENLPFDLLLQVARRVTQVVNIPFSVDMEGGFSRTVTGITDNISKLHDAGVVGINLEDTVPGASRQFRPVDEFKEILSAVTNHISRNNLDIFVNVRTDAFLLGLDDALAETITRIEAYSNAGADGIFVPCITSPTDIKTVTLATTLPINVMCMPNLPDFGELKHLGVKRISMGPFLFNKVYQAASQLAETVVSNGNFTSLFS